MASTNLKFKLKKYNMGGYLRFDDGGMFQNDPEVQKVMQQKQNADKATDAIATGVQAIPVYGQIIGAAIKIGQAVGKQTTDQYGEYKSKGAQVLDNNVNVAKGIQTIGGLANKWDWGQAENLFTAGLLGKDRSQDALKKAKDLAIKRQYANQFEANEETGAKSRSAIGGYQAAPYGKKGMKFRSKTKFSMMAHR